MRAGPREMNNVDGRPSTNDGALPHSWTLREWFLGRMTAQGAGCDQGQMAFLAQVRPLAPHVQVLL